ncbi:hypothetical protein AOLI_G00297710 [Acnodon oligacanthus]
MPAPQRALQTHTAIIADFYLLQLFRCPQLTAYAFIYKSDLAARPSASALAQDSVYVIDIAICLPSALSRHSAFVANNISAQLLDTARKTPPSSSLKPPLTYRRGSEHFRFFTLQSWLHGWCILNGLGYVDNWSSF